MQLSKQLFFLYIPRLKHSPPRFFAALPPAALPNLKQDNYHRQLQDPLCVCSRSPAANHALTACARNLVAAHIKGRPVCRSCTSRKHTGCVHWNHRQTNRLVETGNKGGRRKDFSLFSSTRIIMQQPSEQHCVEKDMVAVFPVACSEGNRRGELTAEQEGAEQQDSDHPPPGPIHSPQGRRHPLWCRPVGLRVRGRECGQW